MVTVNELQGPQHLEGVLPDGQAVKGALLLIQLIHDAAFQQLEDGHQVALVGEHLQQHHDVLVLQHLFTRERWRRRWRALDSVIFSFTTLACKSWGPGGP